MKSAFAIHLNGANAPWPLGFAWRLCGRVFENRSLSRNLDRDRLNGQRPARHDEAELLEIARLELLQHFLRRSEIHHDGGIRALVAQVSAAGDMQLFGRDALAFEFTAGARR